MWLLAYPDPAAAQWAAGVFVVALLTDFLDGYLARKMVRRKRKLLHTRCLRRAGAGNPLLPAARCERPVTCVVGVSRARLPCTRCASSIFRMWQGSAAVQNTHSTFGAFLDPVADKLMVCAVLVLLCTKTFATGLFATYPHLMPCLSVAIVSRELAMSALREFAASAGSAARNLVNVSWVGKYKTTLQLVSLVMLTYSCNGGQGAAVEACAAAGPWLLVAAAGLTVQSFAVYFTTIARHLL